MNIEVIARVSETECEVALCDETGVTHFALVDDGKGRADLIVPAREERAA